MNKCVKITWAPKAGYILSHKVHIWDREDRWLERRVKEAISVRAKQSSLNRGGDLSSSYNSVLKTVSWHQLAPRHSAEEGHYDTLLGIPSPLASILQWHFSCGDFCISGYLLIMRLCMYFLRITPCNLYNWLDFPPTDWTFAISFTGSSNNALQLEKVVCFDVQTKTCRLTDCYRIYFWCVIDCKIYP